MGKLQFEKERALAQGTQKVNSFSGATRSLELSTLEQGDVFTVPEKFEVFKEKIGEGYAEFIFVENQHGDAKKLYPSMFTKSRTMVNEDSTPMTKDGRVVRMSSEGTACTEYRNHATVQEAMESLINKPIEVSEVKIGRVNAFGTKNVVNTQFLVLNFVEK